MNPEASARGTRGPRIGPRVGLALGFFAVFFVGFPALASLSWVRRRRKAA